MIVTKNKEE